MKIKKIILLLSVIHLTIVFGAAEKFANNGRAAKMPPTLTNEEVEQAYLDGQDPEKVAKKFFPLIDLKHPALSKTKQAYESKKFEKSSLPF